MTRVKVGNSFISDDVPVVKFVLSPGITVVPTIAGNDLVLTLVANKEIAFSMPGTLATATGAGAYPLTYPATVTGVILRAGAAPTGTTSTPITGAALVCDVNKNGTTLFTTQGNRPEIQSGNLLSTLAIPDAAVAGLVAGDYLSVDVDFVGSTVPGSDLTVIVQLAA